MRLCIGDIKTRKFLKMIEVVCIDPNPYYDNILYIEDSTGRFYTLRFPNHEALAKAMVEIKDRGSAAMYCEMEYTEYFQSYEDEPQIEIDPYNSEIEDMWRDGYER